MPGKLCPKLTLISSLLLVASLWVQSAGATTLCRQSLLLPRVVSAAEVNAAIDNLAELRMTLDIEKSQGSKTAVRQPLEKEFKNKLRELAEHLHVDVEFLRERLRLRISELQNLGKPKQEKELEKEKRTKEVETVNRPIFELKETIIDLDPAFAGERTPIWIEKVEGSDRLFLGQGDLAVLDLKTKKKEVLIAESRGAVLSRDQKTVMGIDKVGNLNIFSTDTLQKVDTVVLDLKEKNLTPTWLFGPKLSPSGDKIAFNHAWNIVVFDVKTGKYLGEFQGENGNFNIFDFYTESEIIVCNVSSMFKYNITTGEQKLSSKFSGYDLEKLSVDPKHNEVIVVGRPNKGAFTLTGVMTFVVSAKDLSKMYELDYETEMHFSVPETKNLLTMSSEKFPLALYQRSDLDTPVFDFKNYYLDALKVPQTVAFSADGNAAYVFYDEKDPWPTRLPRVIGIDIWKRTADK
jgi:hypothetical protein